MSATVGRAADSHEQAGPVPTAADVFVVFGITGDLAKVMTFRSLYRLERRGLLDCPIVGVAGRRLDGRAAASTRARVDRGHRRDARRGGLRALRRAPLLRAGRLRRRRHLRARGAGASATRSARCSTSRSRRSCSARDQGPARTPASPKPRAWWSRSRSATTSPRRARWPTDIHQYIDESQLYRIDHLPREDGPRGDPLPALRQHDARADLEPQPRRLRADHDGRGLRRRGPRPLLRPGRRAARRRRQPPHAGGGDRRRWRRRPAATPTRSRTPSTRCSARCADADPAHYVRGQYDGYLDIDGVAAGLDHRDLRGAAARDRQLALGRRAVLHPHRQAAAGHPDRAAGRVPPAAAARLHVAGQPHARSRASW